MNLDDLIGKEFKYEGKYGLSDWTDTVHKIHINRGIHTNWSSFKQNKEDFKIIGFTYELYVVSSRSKHHYEFKNCIFIDGKN